jgi:hypothetical protein
MKKTIYAAYGSNLNLEQMAHRCPNATVLGTGELSDYQLLFRGHPSGAVATVEPCMGASVTLQVIAAKNEKCLYCNGYRAQSV